MKSVPEGFVWCGTKGDLTLYLTHIDQHVDSGGEDAALYIRNEHRKIDGHNPITGEVQSGCPAYLIPYQDFWIFRPEGRDQGGMTRIGDMTHRLGNAAAALYGLDVPAYRHRIHDAILEFADDVKNLRPPAGVTREQWLAEMKAAGIVLKINGKELA